MRLAERELALKEQNARIRERELAIREKELGIGVQGQGHVDVIQDQIFVQASEPPNAVGIQGQGDAQGQVVYQPLNAVEMQGLRRSPRIQNRILAFNEI